MDQGGVKMRTGLYYKVQLADRQLLGAAAALPDRLVGLADETLRDLTALKDSVPELDGIGFWPQIQIEGAEAGRVIDAEAGEVIDTVIPPPPVVPQSVTPLQARRALLAAGLLDDVEAYVALQDQAVRLAWDYALEVRRDNAIIVAAAAALGWSAQQLDQLFIQAATL